MQRLVVVVFVACFAACAQADRLFNFEDIRLDNGLRVVTLEDFSTPIVAVQVWYGVGSKDEDPQRQGFAHLFEHMMFRGTERLGPEQHFSLVRSTGGDCNAFTSFDHTAYVNQLPASQLELALWLEAERMMYLKIDQEGFETERKVVEEERRMGINQPYGTVLEEALPVVFTQHPYRWSPIGNIPMLRQAKVSELQQFWDKWYLPSNATLVIVGAVKHADAQALARKYFGWMPAASVQSETHPEPPQTSERQATIEEPIGPVPIAVFVYRTVPVEHPDTVPLELLSIAFGVGESSRLHTDLVRNQQMAAQAEAEAFHLEDDGVFGAGAILNRGIPIEVAITELENQVKRLVEEGVTAAELEKAKNQLSRNIVTNMLTVASKAREIGDATLAHGSPEWLNQRLARIQSATQEDLLRVAKQYLVPEHRTVFRIVPNPDKGLPNEEAAPVAPPEVEPVKREGAKVGVVRPLELPESPPVKPVDADLPLPATSEKTLENGLRVVVVPNKEVPYVTVLLGLDYGAWAEDPAAPGAASAALTLLTKGTEKYTAEQLAEQIELNALTLDGSATLDMSQVMATGLSGKLPLAVELLAEVVLRPTFPEEELALLKQQRAVAMSVREEDVNYIVDRELRRRLHGEHPYSRNPEGELADLQRLTRDVVVAFWKRFARPDACTIYFAGDVEPERAFDLVQQHLGSWKVEGDKPHIELPELPKSDQTRIYLVDKPGAVQSQIRVGQLSITRRDPIYHYARFFTQIYGGAFDSRLNKIIRIQRGLTYGAGGGFSAQRFAGRFISETFTKTESTAETVRAILDVIKSMKDSPPTDEEMNTARAYLTGSFPSDLETPQDAANYQWLIQYCGLSRDYLSQAMQSYKNADKDDVQRVADELVKTESLTIVVAGEAAKIREELEKIAPVTVVEAPAQNSTPPPPAAQPAG